MPETAWVYFFYVSKPRNSRELPMAPTEANIKFKVVE